MFRLRNELIDVPPRERCRINEASERNDPIQLENEATNFAPATCDSYCMRDSYCLNALLPIGGDLGPWISVNNGLGPYPDYYSLHEWNNGGFPSYLGLFDHTELMSCSSAEVLGEVQAQELPMESYDIAPTEFVSLAAVTPTDLQHLAMNGITYPVTSDGLACGLGDLVSLPIPTTPYGYMHPANSALDTQSLATGDLQCWWQEPVLDCSTPTVGDLDKVVNSREPAVPRMQALETCEIEQVDGIGRFHDNVSEVLDEMSTLHDFILRWNKRQLAAIRESSI